MVVGALQLDRLHVALLDKAVRVVLRLLGAYFIAAEGKIPDEKRPLYGS
jgi:hypothetical protein